MNELYENAVVEFIPKERGYKVFNGQAIVSKVGGKFVWCDWHYGMGMIEATDLKLADDQTKVVYQKK